MKKILSILLACGISSAGAQELKSFTEIYDSIQAGNNIRMVINFKNCKPKHAVKVYTAPQAVMLGKDFLQFANSPLTTNEPEFSKQPILENVTYHINSSEEVTITRRIIKLPEYVMSKESITSCPLVKAVRVFN